MHISLIQLQLISFPNLFCDPSRCANMENQQQPPQNTPLCRGNCGFYGSSATEDLCSKCFKDMIQRKQETGTTTTTSSNNNSANNSAQRLASSVSGNNMGASDASTSIPEESESGAADASTDKVEAEYIDDSHTGTKDDAKYTDESGKRPADLETASQATLTSDETPDNPSQQKKTKNRCQVCSKRVGLTGFDCRCGGLFCATHRYDNAHSCTYDYKTVGREQLRKSNPQVVSEKIQPI
uniref:Zinc finger protein n=1 Tax=Meloidogyne javanica TaxID=6303 RepID=A0A915M5V3_MELJA